MTEIRILHVDDEPDIREIAQLSLSLDPDYSVRSCASGEEAMAVAARWKPDLILLDVMMPGLDGPSTLLGLRENATTASIPVIFMTARAQSRETDRFRSLGAAGVIAKPFDPMTLAASVRGYATKFRDSFDDLKVKFLERIQRDAATLSQDRKALMQGNRERGTLDHIQRVAHALSGAGGIYGFAEISEAAGALEDAVMAELSGRGQGDETDLALEGLILLAGTSGDSATTMERAQHVA